MAINFLNTVAVDENVLFVDATNNRVGVGTSTPGSVLDVQGSQGQLFSITDNLSGDIFAVSDISGVPIMTVNSSGLSTFSGSLKVGADAGGYDVFFYGNAAGERMVWDESESRLIINHDTDNFGLGIFTVSSASMTQPQLKVGRDSGQYWGVYTDDRNAHLVHRQDETTGTITTRFDQWDSNITDTNGEWLWRHGNGTGGAMTNALTLTQGGNATFAGSVQLADTKNLQFIGASGDHARIFYTQGDGTTGDVWSHAFYQNSGYQAGIDFYSATEAAGSGSIRFKSGGNNVALTLDTSQNATFAGTVNIVGTNSTNQESVLLRGITSDGSDLLGSIRTANTGGYNQEMRFYTSNASGTSDEDLTLTLKPDQSATFVGDVTAPSFLGDLNGTINTATTGVTQTAGNNSTLIATTAYADAAAAAVPVGDYLPLTGGTMTGSIAMSNQNITGVNQITINDPGEGIIFQGTTNVNLYVIDDTTDSIVNFDNASEIRRDGVRVADVPYIASRSQQLMTNYNGLLGNNYNFPGWTFDGEESNYSPGSFKFVGSSGNSFTSEFMAVDTAYKYKMSLDAKTLNGVGRYYCMTLCYDVDQNQINANHHMYRANTSTTLAVALNPGDTTVTLAGTGSNWYDGGTAGVSTHLRSLIIWEYTNSLGYTYPPETYSRLWYSNAWDPNSINGNVITLRTAWTGPSYPVGTRLSNGSAGGSYKYNVMSNTLLTTDWVQYSGFMDGVDLSGTNVYNKFPPGTSKIKMGFLPNYNSGSTGADTIWITNFNVGIDTVLTKGDQSIAGTKTFTTVPVVGTMAVTDDSTSAASTAWVKDQAYITSASVGDGEINGATSGLGISGSMSATANQAGNTTFTVTSNAATAATANTIAYRDSSADLTARLFRANYANQNTISGAMAFRVNNGTDNYTRYCSSSSAIRTFLGVPASGDLNNYLLNTTDTFTGSLIIDGDIRGNGQQLILNAGESGSYATGQTDEYVYANAESGLIVSSSPDNWGSGWAGRNTAHINKADASSYLPGDLSIASALLSNQENTDIDTGAEVVAQVAHATYTAAFFDFVVKKGTNVRSGTVYACHNGDTTPLVEFTETSTNDLGDTSDVTLSVDISGANMRLLATVTSDDWIVKSLIRAI